MQCEPLGYSNYFNGCPDCPPDVANVGPIDSDEVYCWMNYDLLGEKRCDELGELFAASPVLLAEMVRYLPVIERAEQDPELWARLTTGTGIATANGYREAIRKTQPNLEVK